MLRAMIRLLLAAVLFVSVAVIGVALKSLGPHAKETWATVAAALAVVTSVFSSWSARGVLELQQDLQRPYPYPFIDATSRYGLLLLRITNFGGSAAHDIQLRWVNPLLNSRGEQVTFSRRQEGPEIPVLLPKESLSVIVDGEAEFYSKYQECNYSGEIDFRDASGKKRRYPFCVSAEKFRWSPTHDEETPKTLYELQQIPKELQKLSAEIKEVRLLLERR